MIYEIALLIILIVLLIVFSILYTIWFDRMTKNMSDVELQELYNSINEQQKGLI